MKLIKTFYLIPFFVISCSPAQIKPTYVKNYECIETYLKLKGVNSVEPDILVKEKETNLQTLRIFNGDNGIVHSDENYTPKLYNKESWEKLYRTYSNDTIGKYWKNEDFPTIDFVLGSEKAALRGDFLDIYTFTTKKVISLSEPMYYIDDKHVIFFYNKSPMGLYGYGEKLIVIMKMENGKWIVLEEVPDYLTPM
jgi:hypothetical protein